MASSYVSFIPADTLLLQVHCVDLTGEPLWSHQMQTKYTDAAKKSKAILIHGAGFDSVPSECVLPVRSKYGKLIMGCIKSIYVSSCAGTAQIDISSVRSSHSRSECKRRCFGWNNYDCANGSGGFKEAGVAPIIPRPVLPKSRYVEKLNNTHKSLLIPVLL